MPNRCRNQLGACLQKPAGLEEIENEHTVLKDCSSVHPEVAGGHTLPFYEWQTMP
jgi:hypothetical protein